MRARIIALVLLGIFAPACAAQEPAPLVVAVNPNDPVHPLAQRQATAQAQQAPTLQQAREAAEVALATREAAAVAAFERAKAEAVKLLGAAATKRQAGLFSEAIELARQAQEKWPEYGDAKEFLGDIAPTATAQARTAQAQATAEARPTATPRGGRAPGRPAAPTPTLPPILPLSPSEQAKIDRGIELISTAGGGALQELSVTLVERGVSIGYGTLPSGVGAIWRTKENAITLSDRYRNSPVEATAGLLVHEATHAYDFARGRFTGTSADCFDLEGRAFANQAKFWEALYGKGGKKGASDALEREMNNILHVVNEKPLTFAIELLGIYSHQCT